MGDELKAALQGLDTRLTGQMTQLRTNVMARFDRMEDRLGSLDARLSVHVTQSAGLTEQVSAREQQLELLQDAIRAGITAESKQVPSQRTTILEMQQLVNRMQSQIDGINARLDAARRM